jgi:hypothetical protein
MTISSPVIPLPVISTAIFAAKESGVIIRFAHVKYSNFCKPSMAAEKIAVTIPGRSPNAASKKKNDSVGEKK